MVSGGAKTFIKDCCFVNNDFFGVAPIILELTDDPNTVLVGNYATEQEDGVDCVLAAYYATEEDRENFNHVCVESQVDKCVGAIDTGGTPEPAGMTPTGNPLQSGSSTWQSIGSLTLLAILLMLP
jgi:hypothetical protein